MSVGLLFGLACAIGAAGFLFVLILADTGGIHLGTLADAPAKASGVIAAALTAWVLAFGVAFLVPALSGDVRAVSPWVAAAACVTLSFLGARLAPGAWPPVAAGTILGGAIIAALFADYLTYLVEWQSRSPDGFGSDDIPGAIMIWVAIVFWVPLGLFVGLLIGVLASRTRPRQF